MIVLLAFVWAGMLVFVALAAYSYGWWWRGRFEAKRQAEREVALRRQWEWNRHMEEVEQRHHRPEGPPKLRVVE